MELYLKLYNWRLRKIWIKYFDCEFDMDKFIRRLAYVPDVSVIEDSREIFFPDYNI